MPAFKGIFFGGRGIIKPGAYSVIDASRLRPNRLSPSNTGGAVGIAEGGNPNEVLTFNSISEARGVLRSGSLLDLLEKAYNPSGDQNGAGEIKVVRVNEATVSALNIADSGATDVITLTSLDYGLLQNQLRAKVESPGSLGGVKITVQDISEDRPALEIGDNLGNQIIVQYVGAADACLLDIGLTGESATSLVMSTATASSPIPADDVSLNLTLIGYNNLDKIATFIGGLPSYTVTKAPGADTSMPSSYLDPVVAQDILTALYTVTANIGAIIHWSERFSNLVSVVRIGSERDAPADVGFFFMAGGTENIASVTPTRWGTALALLEDVVIDSLIVDEESAVIQSAALAHCEAMSDVKARRERRLFAGLAVGSSDEDAIGRALELTSPRCTVVYPGIKVRDRNTGAVLTVGGKHSAAHAYGMTLGSVPASSLTNKTIRVVGLEKNLNLTSIEKLLNGGVTPLEFRVNDGTFRIVQGLTTYLKDANVALRKLIGMRVNDFISLNLRNTAEPFIGEVGDKTTIQSIRNAIIVQLNNLTRSPTNPNGVLTEGVDEDGADQPAWRNLVVDYDGLELVTITVDVSPVGEIAYITITATLVPNRIRLAS